MHRYQYALPLKSSDGSEKTRFYRLILDLVLFSVGLGTRGVYFHYVHMQRHSDVPLTYTVKSLLNSLHSLQQRGSKLWGRKMNSQSDYNIAVGVVSSHMTAVPQPVTRVLEEDLPLLAGWRKKASTQKLWQLVMKNYKRLDNQNLTSSMYTAYTKLCTSDKDTTKCTSYDVSTQKKTCILSQACPIHSSSLLTIMLLFKRKDVLVLLQVVSDFIQNWSIRCTNNSYKLKFKGQIQRSSPTVLGNLPSVR